MNSFDWGSTDSQGRQESYHRELEELWQHAARLRAMRAVKASKSSKSGKSGKTGKSGRGGRGGSAEGEGES